MNWPVLLLLMLSMVAPPDAVDFETEILPALTKSGCNAGACHGAATGRGGFRLSLFGSNPDADFESIVHALEGRRVNLAEPESSLILLKPTGQLEHGGGLVLEQDDRKKELLLQWIRAGVPRNSRTKGRGKDLIGLEVTPRQKHFDVLPARISLRAIATFADGHSEDVTSLTTFSSQDPSAVTIEDDSQAVLKRSGQHSVIARFVDQVVALQFSAPLNQATFDFSFEQNPGYIDTQIQAVLAEMRVPLSPRASDSEWLRRVSLDLTGCLPKPVQIEEFLANESPDKREHFVDSLLSSDAFVDYWTLHFARLLQMHSLRGEEAALEVYAGWLRQQLAEGVSLKELARQLLTASGDSHAVGPANFGRMVGDARAHAELVGRFFLGAHLECANCHNHPLDKWTQDDYHGLAAVFARLERGRQVRLAATGSVTNLRTGEPAISRIPGVRDLSGDGDHRVAVLEWVTAAERPYFARATVNRLWQAMFGRGLVDPVDDLRDTNPATHPELLEMLTKEFVDHGYDIRHALRQMVLSDTYSRSSEVIPGNELDDRFYSRYYRRPLRPEVFVDALVEVTGVAEIYGDQGAIRAVELLDPLTPATSLEILGRCVRPVGCANTVMATPSLPAQLHLLNGALINQKLSSQEGRLHRLITAERSDKEIIEEFYRRGLGRVPDERDLLRWTRSLAVEDPQERVERLEDFLWSLLNSRDFRENH